MNGFLFEQLVLLFGTVLWVNDKNRIFVVVFLLIFPGMLHNGMVRLSLKEIEKKTSAEASLSRLLLFKQVEFEQ